VQVFNEVAYAPRMDDYKALDPSGDWAPVYNRYAHITVNSAPPGSGPTFAVLQGDSFLLSIHPCDSRLETVGIKYFVFSYPPSGQETSCLELVQGPVSKKFYLYRRKHLREAASPITSGSS